MSAPNFELASERDIDAAVGVFEAAFYEWDGRKDREKAAAAWRGSTRSGPPGSFRRSA